MPITLPMCPPEALPIGNSCFAVLISDDTFTYFSNLVPFDSHPADDRAAMLLRIGRLAMVSNIPQRDLVDAFGVSRATVQRAQRRYLAEGEAAFLKPRRGRGPSVFTPELVKRATALLEAGLSGAAVARALGVSVASVNKWRRQGLIGRPALGPMPDAGAPSERRVDEEAAGAVGSETTGRLEVQPLTETAEIGEPGLFDAGTQLDRTARDRRDRQAPMGRATCDVPGRVLASSGQAGPVEPQFTTAARGVRFAGVLTALPALLKEGLLAATDVLPALPKGYYGPTAILLFLAFMTLARVRNPESLRYQPPGEWGAILGLDRCPEVKTLRRKIALVAGDEASVRTWQLALAKRWQEEEPDLWATLAPPSRLSPNGPECPHQAGSAARREEAVRVRHGARHRRPHPRRPRHADTVHAPPKGAQVGISRWSQGPCTEARTWFISRKRGDGVMSDKPHQEYYVGQCGEKTRDVSAFRMLPDIAGCTTY